jgi:hypothetical protein
MSRDWKDKQYPWHERCTLAEQFRAVETARQATRVILALEAWKLQHGSLPKSLDELVGPCLDRLPVDPYSGQPFRYFRDGLKIPLHWSQFNFDPYARGDIPVNTPFIWSTGARVVRNPNPLEKDTRREYSIYSDRALFMGAYDEQYAASEAHSQYHVWESGWPFPIP